jgi:hypothetical protein
VPHVHLRFRLGNVSRLHRTQSRRHVRVLLHRQSLLSSLLCPQNQPAPSITLDSPLHNVLNPSTLEIVTIAFDMPVYMPAGEGFTTCILVFCRLAQSYQDVTRVERKRRTFNRSTGYITECSYGAVSTCGARRTRAKLYGNARERAGDHVRGKREVWWEGFISEHLIRFSFLEAIVRRAVLMFFIHSRPLLGGHKSTSGCRRRFQFCDGTLQKV